MSVRRCVVKWFDAKKGYGFIVHPDEGMDIFVHYSQIVSENRFKSLRTGEPVEFELSDGPKGVHAANVVSLAPLEEVDALSSDEAQPSKPVITAPENTLSPRL